MHRFDSKVLGFLWSLFPSTFFMFTPEWIPRIDLRRSYYLIINVIPEKKCYDQKREIFLDGYELYLLLNPLEGWKNRCQILYYWLAFIDRLPFISKWSHQSINSRVIWPALCSINVASFYSHQICVRWETLSAPFSELLIIE